MDINLIRSAILVAVVAAFVVIAWRAYLPSRRAALERAARSILEEDGP